jgi:TetR/AcrR family transcriptional repressor of mexCD-oprJ operon
MRHGCPIVRQGKLGSVPPAEPSGDLQSRVAGVIVDAAARALASRPDAISMGDVAAEAGVARATVYRYFPSRQSLVDEVVGAGVERTGAGLRSARIDEVPVRDGVARAVRAILAGGPALVVAARQRASEGPDELEGVVLAPLLRLLANGQRAGEIRDDVPARWLAETLLTMAVGVVSIPPASGTDDSVAAVSSVFLDGARPIPSTPTTDAPGAPGRGAPAARGETLGGSTRRKR